MEQITPDTKGLLTEAAVALFFLGEDKHNCGCESGGYSGPEFICGTHKLMNRILDVLKSDIEDLLPSEEV